MKTNANVYVVKRSHAFKGQQLRLPGHRQQQDLKSIKLLAGDGNYTKVFLLDATHPLMVSHSLKFFADQLPGFIRVSRGTLLNPNVIRKVILVHSKLMKLELTTGEFITASRRRISTVLEQLSLPPLKATEESPLGNGINEYSVNGLLDRRA
ncbi:LytTR family DNA-binding domain-containing protein [Spirosoma rigui]|uniref:LytTR family DNA-binding domain-containing protein n=1 Tax=Spirosoma rigui TaxID=564064 RepID=UPI0009B0098F|nr:LytTR family DNA-binding domain-containing protein [Spirosoma rigui]